MNNRTGLDGECFRAPNAALTHTISTGSQDVALAC